LLCWLTGRFFQISDVLPEKLSQTPHRGVRFYKQQMTRAGKYRYFGIRESIRPVFRLRCWNRAILLAKGSTSELRHLAASVRT